MALVVKKPVDNTEDLKDGGVVPGLGRSPGVGNCNPPQYSCLENPMGRGDLLATVHGITKSKTWLNE